MRAVLLRSVPYTTYGHPQLRQNNKYSRASPSPPPITPASAHQAHIAPPPPLDPTDSNSCFYSSNTSHNIPSRNTRERGSDTNLATPTATAG